jgi:uncharacterized membrane protein YfcA
VLNATLAIIVAAAAGSIASVTGFGIGSLLTPLLALQVDTRLAVAAVSVPHVVGTALRFWLLRGRLDRRVFWNFGLASAGGGLTGALLHGWASNRWLTIVFGLLLLFAAASEASGLARRMRFHGAVAWTAGTLSGLLGGLVGNQGGIRSAALLGFNLAKEQFVATATAIALLVDAARMPIYAATQYEELTGMVGWMALASLGVVAGTLLGNRLLVWIPERWFRRALALILALLGVSMLARGIAAENETATPARRAGGSGVEQQGRPCVVSVAQRDSGEADPRTRSSA